MYTSNRMECFSHKGGCGICVPRCLKEELAWKIDKWLQLISTQNYTAYYTELQMNYASYYEHKLQLHYTTLRSLFWLLLHLLRYAAIANEICQIPFTIKPIHYYSIKTKILDLKRSRNWSLLQKLGEMVSILKWHS